MAFPIMVSFQLLTYGSELTREGRAAHLDAGAMRRGLSCRTVFKAGVLGLNVSAGQAMAAFATNVGVENTPELVYSAVC